MSSQVPSTAPVAAGGSAPATGAGNTAAAANQASIASGNISSMADLQQQAPDVYQAMMQGIAMNICQAMQQDQEDLQKMQEEFRREEEDS